MATRRLPLGLLGSMALAALIETGIGSLEGRFLVKFDRESWRYAAKAAEGAATDASILTFGDSTTKFGMLPPAVEAASGMSTFNLAGFGGTPASNYLMLRRAVDAGARPRAVVLGLLPGNLRQPPKFYMQQWMLFASAREILDLSVTTRDPSMFGIVAAGRLMPSLRRRFEIHDQLVDWFAGRDVHAAADDFAERRRVWRCMRGGELLRADETLSMAVNYGDKHVFPDAWGVEPSGWTYLRRMFDLAAEVDATVFYVMLPLAQDTQDAVEGRGLDDRYTEMLQKMQAKYPRMVVLDVRRSGYPDAAFHDPVHLNTVGALRLSHDVGSAIRRHLDDTAPRVAWVELPAYRDVPGPALRRAELAARPIPDGAVRR